MHDDSDPYLFFIPPQKLVLYEEYKAMGLYHILALLISGAMAGCKSACRYDAKANKNGCNN